MDLVGSYQSRLWARDRLTVGQRLEERIVTRKLDLPSIVALATDQRAPAPTAMLRR